MRYLIALLGILTCIKSEAAVYGFNTIPSEFKKSSDETVVKNMPPVRSQDSIGICYAFSAGAVLEHSICEEKNLDCTNLADTSRPSSIDLNRYAYGNSKPSDVSDPNTYRKRVGSVDPKDYTFGLDVLQGVFSTQSIIKESCAPFDRFVANAKSPEEQAKLEYTIWKQFKDSYDIFQKKYKQCAECALADATVTANADDLITKYGLKSSNQEVLKAMASASYQEFLYKAIVPAKCSRSEENKLSFNRIGKEVQSWPNEKDMGKPDYNTAILKIKSALSKNEPVIVDKFCTLSVVTTDCARHTSNGQTEAGGHSFVITGYRKMCNSSGQCYDAVKVHNSWGQTWQDQNNDGWVDAKTLIDRTQYQYASLVWIEKTTK